MSGEAQGRILLGKSQGDALLREEFALRFGKMYF